MKKSKISTILLGIASSAILAFFVAKSNLSYNTDYAAGTSKVVANETLNLQTSQFNPQLAWKIFNWKIWKAAGDVAVASVAAVAGALACKLIDGSTSSMVDVTTSILYKNTIDQKDVMLEELN